MDADVGAAFATQRYREPAGYADEQDDRFLAITLVGWASCPSSAGKMPTPQENFLHYFSLASPLPQVPVA